MQWLKTQPSIMVSEGGVIQKGRIAACMAATPNQYIFAVDAFASTVGSRISHLAVLNNMWIVLER